MIWIDVSRQVRCGLVTVFVINRFNCGIKFRIGFDFHGSKVGNKRGRDRRTVFISHVCTNRQIVACPGRDAKKRQRRRKEEKSDAALRVKSADLREDRKRRVVDHHAAVRVGLVLIVASGVKWPNNRRALQAVVLQSPVADHLVDVLRRVAVVGGEFRLEFIHKFLIILAAFALDISPKVVSFCRWFRPLVGADMDRLDLVHCETGQRGVERKAAQLFHLKLEPRRVPLARFGKSVVGDDVGAPLRLGQVAHRHIRDLGHAFGPRRLDAPMSGDEVALLVDQHGRDEAKLAQAAPQLLDLLRPVDLRVVCVGDQLIDAYCRQVLDRHVHRRLPCCLILSHALPPVDISDAVPGPRRARARGTEP